MFYQHLFVCMTVYDHVSLRMTMTQPVLPCQGEMASLAAPLYWISQMLGEATAAASFVPSHHEMYIACLPQ